MKLRKGGRTYASKVASAQEGKIVFKEEGTKCPSFQISLKILILLILCA